MQEPLAAERETHEEQRFVASSLSKSSQVNPESAMPQVNLRDEIVRERRPREAERNLRDGISRELCSREADVYKTKELTGGAAHVRVTHHGSRQEPLAAERATHE